MLGAEKAGKWTALVSNQTAWTWAPKFEESLLGKLNLSNPFSQLRPFYSCMTCPRSYYIMSRDCHDHTHLTLNWMKLLILFHRRKQDIKWQNWD